MDKSEEVLSFLFEPGSHSPVLLCFGPEPFDQVPVLVPRPINNPLSKGALPTRDHRLPALTFDRGNDLFGVVPFVPDDNFKRNSLDESFGLGHVGRLTRSQDQLDRQPQSVHGRMDLGPEPTPTAPQGLFVLAAGAVRFLGAPAAHGCARIT